MELSVLALGGRFGERQRSGSFYHTPLCTNNKLSRYKVPFSSTSLPIGYVSHTDGAKGTTYILSTVSRRVVYEGPVTETVLLLPYPDVPRGTHGKWKIVPPFRKVLR